MQTYSFEGTLTALSSVTHNGGQSYGINQKLRREKFVQPDGRIEEVPTISGNGMRGLLRDKGMLHFVRALGYGIEQDGEVKGLSLPAFHFLFSGGSLTSSGGKAIDIEGARDVRRLIPLVSVFGGAMGNAILPGKLKVNKAIPICTETAHLLPERYTTIRTLGSCWDLTQEEMYTRKDDAKNLHLRGVLDAGTQKLIEQADAANRAKTEAGEPLEANRGSQQMMYFIETFAAGTLFHWRLILEDPSDLEFEALLCCLAEFQKSPFAGGKSGTGMGEMRCNFDGWNLIETKAERKNEVGKPVGKLYQQHIEANGDAIRKTLAEMQ
jgi:CRISPR type IV-associated protein Csf2